MRFVEPCALFIFIAEQRGGGTMLDMILLLLMAINIAFGGTAGNIDLDNRVVVTNPDGSISTELSFSTEIDGFEVLLPQVVNGSVVSQAEAIEHYVATGEHLGKFVYWQAAEQYAEVLHCRQEQHYRR
jgi:hypothetical protein